MLICVGDFNEASIGIAVHCVPMELCTEVHVLHASAPTMSEYSLNSIAHVEQFGEPCKLANFPASHGAHETAPDVLALPGSHAVHLVVAGAVPTQPAGHARK
jgi:hypothetical protein